MTDEHKNNLESLVYEIVCSGLQEKPLRALYDYIDGNFEPKQQVKVEPEVIQKPKPKTLQAIFEIIDNVDFELARLEDIAKGEIGDKITLLRKYIDENRVSA